MANGMKRGKLGILVGGGPAPGINGVIAAATIEGVNQGFEVIGFRDGFKWLAQGDTQHYTKLTIDDVKYIHLRGGSILGTARTNPAKSETSMHNVIDVMHKLGVTALVTIGGDDTAFSASQVYRRGKGVIRVAHVPKTIDNDLPLPGATPTFGFETARHNGVFILRNLSEDAHTTSRWYIVISMGRSAGHLALGIGKAAAAAITIIPEEFRGRPVTAEEVCDMIIGSIIKRKAEGTLYGVAVLAEGLIEAMGEKGLVSAVPGGSLDRYGKVVRDDFGHLRLGEIEFGRLMKDILTARLEQLGIKMTFIDKDLGYELRCADPIPFDGEYTRNLGYGAVKFILSPDAAEFGAIISFIDGKMVPLQFEKMLNPETGRFTVRPVNVDGEAYECACHYMIRLEKSDFEDVAQLNRLAAVVAMTPEQFKARFGYLVGLK
ncbi:MAG TPA: diphosphate--fructose-6-phosphate 1-phosphotransferase [Verrucomicrobiota bacterium]|jgi:6-phosphofructokinase 1|nr:6-phosphofructokinase [Verrucomicrobiota bacterium]OQB88194.1 MAG: Pyrophosphate--fructose 6-phosphate 1-phosphotransferase [Verrucomicrobia bacterium ADurb.Bin118]HPY29845.1 diphosphate--fructose-6-phosphate 1-phosphotransferase [Verrucomicrobiota bacterium]HQB16342.1 diphosphate--fructose-6-phosphate 1-phosphotransferase [Verrucomicrobiota bacterium]